MAIGIHMLFPIIYSKIFSYIISELDSHSLHVQESFEISGVCVCVCLQVDVRWRDAENAIPLTSSFLQIYYHVCIPSNYAHNMNMNKYFVSFLYKCKIGHYDLRRTWRSNKLAPLKGFCRKRGFSSRNSFSWCFMVFADWTVQPVDTSVWIALL